MSVSSLQQTKKMQLPFVSNVGEQSDIDSDIVSSVH